MTGNSIIISNTGKSCSISSYGCSEFVAQKTDLDRYTTICAYMLSELYSKDSSTAVARMESWIRFVYEAFVCMNIAVKPFITLYTVADLKKEKPSGMSGLGISFYSEGGQSNLSINGRDYPVSEETLLGISVDVSAIRVHFNVGGNNARKVQLTHTALRFAWSNAHEIAETALMLSEIAPSIDKLCILNIATFLRGQVIKNGSYDYGSLHDSSPKLITKDSFLSRFRDHKVTGVQAHFTSEDSPLIKMISQEENLNMNYLLSFNGKEITKKDLLNPPDGYGDYLTKWVEKFLQSKDINKLKIEFMFVKTIFKSTAPNVPYSGYQKAGKTIDRILFEDEEGTILSIPKNSSLIKVK